MKSEDINERLQTLEKSNRDSAKISTSGQIDAFFSGLSSTRVAHIEKQANEKSRRSFKTEETFSSQLNVDLKESLKPLNPLEAFYNDCVGPFREQSSSKDSNIVSSTSRSIRKILNNDDAYQQALRDSRSVLYDVVVFDLLELNRHQIDQTKDYSENIDDYFRSKTGQRVFELSNNNYNDFRKLIDNKDFPKYYEYGFNSKETEQSFDLKIDKNFLETFKNFIYINLKQHNFNLNSKEICESPNNYEVIDVTQRQQLMKKKTRAL